uniref:Kinesin family member 15 n=1 Tax=Callorhinchus milii TaxID=7868 RepID=A0A4W3IA94_CALMI|eukprot:gi/632967234/ref/XP_007899866.1/ PREDICTED: kinesin-like protein KIF15 isoform X1 [Callorhinchus milii]
MSLGEQGDMIDVPSPQPPSAEGDSIKVYVRVRPPVKGTALFNDGDQGQCLSVISSNAVRLNSKPEPKIFTYDHVADIHTTQESVFSVVAKGIIESCMNGYNGTIFAYGQTGSGKTFTMLGPSDDSDNFTHNLRGVIPRSFEYLFYLISREKEKAGDGKDFLCKCSFIEIYNEQIYDLLDPASSGLFLRENIKTGVFVEGVIERVVTSAAEAYQVLSMGWRNRSVASTSMNRESSRSHAVFTVTIESKEKISNLFNIRTSQLNLVDLAGSERQRDTRAEGVRLKEASSINRSLSCLGNVIMGLIDVASGKNRHICYRDSKLTFLLRDSLGGNAKTYIIANVHPGSRCFGETLSTLQFARRAKLIKNKATVNEATQGSLGHLQAEIKRLKEQLAEQRTGHISQDSNVMTAELDPNEWKSRFLEAMLLREKSESEKQGLKEKIGQLKDLCAKKEKILQSNKMIVKFRETNIARLEKLQKESCGGLALDEKDSVIGELREEIQTLKEQIEQDPRVVSYAMENRGLREENKYLRSLESVKRAGDITLHKAAKLEKAFLEASSSEKNAGGPALHLTPTTIENISTVSQERLKARLLQAQSDMSSVKQEYEEYQELTRKKQMEFESEVQCLLKANQHLENILEATKAHKRQEVSQLNKMHVETIKSLTTPTKAAYNLRSRLVLRMSPDGTPSAYGEANAWSQGGDTMNESLPLDMNEQAYEAIAKELQMVQEQLANTQTKLDEEESQKVKLQQQFDKLEHHSAQINELLSSERTDRNKEQQELVTKTRSLEKELQEMQGQNNLLQSEVHDLRVVLCSADKELILVKDEYSTYKLKQDAEHSQLSDKLVDVHLQLDNIRLEHEKNLEEKRSLQDAYDNLQEVVEFKAHEADQLCAKLLQTKEEAEVLRTEMSPVMKLLETEKERNQKLASQLKEDIETNSKELLKALDENDQLKKQYSELNAKSEQQVIELKNLEQSLADSRRNIGDLERACTADKEVVTVLMNQTQEMRSLLSEKTEAVSALTQELEEIKLKYSSAVAAKEEKIAIIDEKQKEIVEMKETMERKTNCFNVQMEILSEDLTNTIEQLEQLTEDSKKQTAIVQMMQEEVEKKEAANRELQTQLNEKNNELQEARCQYGQKVVQTEYDPDTSTNILPQTPTTPSLRIDLIKIIETQEKELNDQKASQATLEFLLEEMESERRAKNEEILQLKSQLCELKNVRLEMEESKRHCRSLEFHLENDQKETQKSNGLTVAELEKSMIKADHNLMEELKTQETLMEKMFIMEAELKETRATLEAEKYTKKELAEKLERARNLEAKAFEEKEACRSKLESASEEKERLTGEIEAIRKQVSSLTEENGKLLGHQNIQQKIQYLVKVKKENSRLIEEVEILKLKLKELSKKPDLNKSTVLDTSASIFREHDENVF